ncbi:MAG: hypothetical protein M3O15_12745 [Acidobacteriota bacterium]|nr:hypothetical protein [Acidobacteriota bacterium]
MWAMVAMFAMSGRSRCGDLRYLRCSWDHGRRDRRGTLELLDPIVKPVNLDPLKAVVERAVE